MNFKSNTLGVLVSAGTTAAMVVGLGAGIAHADPVNSPNTVTCVTDTAPTPDVRTCTNTAPRTLVLVGSETTTPVMQALAEDAAALAIGGAKQVDSWNATPADTTTGNPPVVTLQQRIVTRSGNAACNIPRPNGSSAGRSAFLTSLGTAGTPNGCINGARSSSGHLGSNGSPITTNPDLTFIPFAKESISFAITNTSNFSISMTNQALVDFFNCDTSTFFTPVPMLPQNGSGTRSYWLTEMYGTATIPNTGPISGAECVQNGVDEAGATIEEHDGRKVNNSEIVPMSVAQWASQTAGVITNVRGSTRVGQINGTNPFALDFAKQREVFNVFSKSDVDAVNPPAGSVAATIQALFVGPASQICSNPSAVSIVRKFGLFTTSNCGDTTGDTL